jgi:oxygen-dependent protoporphyrinogen oxidase
LAQLLRQVEYNPIVVVGLDYREEVNPRGFGVLTTYMKSLGILLDKYIFPHRNGIRVMLGGGRYPDLAELDEKRLIELAEEGVYKIYGLKNPTIRWIKVHKRGIPVYRVGHQKLVEEIEREAAQIGVILTGNWKGGVSFNDCIKSSYALSQQIEKEL